MTQDVIVNSTTPLLSKQNITLGMAWKIVCFFYRDYDLPIIIITAVAAHGVIKWLKTLQITGENKLNIILI